jgi:hypothetical protein
MDKELREFDVMPSADMQSKGGMYAENWQPLQIDASEVPEDLRDLIPWAAKFGVTCDITRHDVGDKTPQTEKDRLSEVLRGRHARIGEWLNENFPFDVGPREVSVAQAAFTAMCVFELEENGGPGLPGAPASYGQADKQREQETRNRFKRLSHGPPCPRCGEPLRTRAARKCFACGAQF